MGDAQGLLTDKERQTLLRLARYVLERFVQEGIGRFPLASLTMFEITETLRRPSGVFVTYHRQGRLRGCIGNILPSEPLFQAVVENAMHSAAHDPRFAPVDPEEVAGIRIEISVMSPLIPVGELTEIEVGRDGLILQASGRTGVFLPQVPVECGWDKTQYLEQLGLKAGLDIGAYLRKDARLQRFTAQVFSEP